MSNIDELVEKQTKEMVDKQFAEFMEVYQQGQDSTKVVIQDAKETLDIFKVARAFGVLPRLNRWEAQSNHVQIKCPFHDDTNPSCSLWRDINAFKCWACGTKGDIITFIQLLQSTDKVPVTLLKKMLEKDKLHRK